MNSKNSYENYVSNNTTFKTNRTYQIKFSFNVVRLKISSSNLLNLSLCNLFEIINVSNVSKERYLIDLVRNLIQQYIQANNFIILLALLMIDDSINFNASKLIRDEKIETRTIEMLTKLDRVQKVESLDQ